MEREEPIEESDQLPEEAPAEVAEDDAPATRATETTESPGAADDGSDSGQATGHPDNAG